MRPSLLVMMMELQLGDLVLLLVEDPLHLLLLFIPIHKVLKVKVKENMKGVEDMDNNMAIEANKRQLDGHIMTIGGILMNHFSRFNPICHLYLLMPVAVMDPHNMKVVYMLIPDLHRANKPSHHEGSNVDFMIWLHHYFLIDMDSIYNHLLDMGNHRRTTTMSLLLLNIHISISCSLLSPHSSS